MNSQHKVIDKIKKLLALSENNTEIEEAAAAAAQAQKLMAKHNITRYMLESVNSEEYEEENVTEFEIADLGINKKHWKAQLLGAIANNNYCKHFVLKLTKPQKTHKLVVIGTQNDAKTVKYMYHYLTAEVERLCKRDNNKYGKTWANNYKLGAVFTIRERLEREKEKVIKETEEVLKDKCLSSGLDIVHVDSAIQRLKDKENKVENVYSQKDLYMPPPPKFEGDYGAFLKGKEAAREINLEKNTGLPDGKQDDKLSENNG